MNRKKVGYIGVFTEQIPGLLDKTIESQHITFSFKPDEDKFKEALPYLGAECSIKILGYGNDGHNEGLLVQVNSSLPYYASDKQHITLSVSENCKPVDTAKLDFNQPIPEYLGLHTGDVISGKVGAFSFSHGPVFDGKQFEEWEP